LAGHPDDQSLRLDQAFREVSSRHKGDVPSAGATGAPEAPEAATADAPRAAEPAASREIVRQVVREEVAAALGESDLAVELGILVAAVEHLKQRVDALAAASELPETAGASTSASGRGVLKHGLRSMSTGRAARGR
jgi:hypothetical protein